MKKYFVPEGMKDFLSIVFKRDFIPYLFFEVDERQYVSVPLSCRQYRVMLEDAECERERSMHRSNVPIYSFRTLMNQKKFHRLRQLNKEYHGFGVLSRDVERFEQAI